MPPKRSSGDRRRRPPPLGRFSFGHFRWEVGLPVCLLGMVMIAYSLGAAQASIGITIGAVVLAIGLALLFLMPGR